MGWAEQQQICKFFRYAQRKDVAVIYGRGKKDWTILNIFLGVWYFWDLKLRHKALIWCADVSAYKIALITDKKDVYAKYFIAETFADKTAT